MHFVSASCSRFVHGAMVRRSRVVFVRVKATLVAAIALLWAGSSVAQDGAATATLRATTLSGADVTLPDPERAAVLVVGFGRDAGQQVRPWRSA